MSIDKDTQNFFTFSQLIATCKEVTRLSALLERKGTKYSVVVWTDAWSDLKIGAVESNFFKERFATKKYQDLIRKEIRSSLTRAKKKQNSLLGKFKDKELALQKAMAVASKENW